MNIVTAVAQFPELGGVLHRQCAEGFTWIDALLAQQPILWMGQLRLRCAPVCHQGHMVSFMAVPET